MTTTTSVVSQVLFPNRFTPPAGTYTTGRPLYPQLLSRRVAALVGLTTDDAVLDVGTGPGFLAIDFAPLAASVTALDPSEEMLSIARQNADRAEVEIELVKGGLFELTPQLGCFKLVTIGRTFRWTEADQLLAALDRLVVRGGAVSLYGERRPDVAENAWHRGFQALLDSYAAADPSPSRAAPQQEVAFLRSRFAHVERISVLERRNTPIQRFVDRALSLGDGRTGAREGDLAREARRLIAAYARADGTVQEVVEGHALIAFRPSDIDIDIDIDG